MGDACKCFVVPVMNRSYNVVNLKKLSARRDYLKTIGGNMETVDISDNIAKSFVEFPEAWTQFGFDRFSHKGSGVIIVGSAAREHYSKMHRTQPSEDYSRENLIKQLTKVLNGHENSCNTPDFILAEFLTNAFTAVIQYTHERENWYGVKHAPGQPTTMEKLLPGPGLSRTLQEQNDLLMLAYHAQHSINRLGVKETYDRQRKGITEAFARLGLSQQNIEEIFGRV